MWHITLGWKDGATFGVHSTGWWRGAPGAELTLTVEEMRRLGPEGIREVVEWFAKNGDEYAFLQDVFHGPCQTIPEPRLEDWLRVVESHLATDDQREIARDRICNWGRGFVTDQYAPPAPKKAPEPGTVYVLEAEDGSKRYKIGKTKQLQTRKEHLETRLPFTLRLEASFESPDPTSLERGLHKLFASKRLNGEWFQLDDDDLEMLRKYCEARL